MEKSRYELVSQVGLSEPRVLHLRNLINILLNYVDFENEGKIVKVDGFSIKNMKEWLINLPTSEFIPYMESISGECSCRCKFCFEKGNPIPVSIPMQTVRRNITIDDIKYREKYYNPLEKKSLFSICSAQKEIFCNGNVLEIYKYLRDRYPKELIRMLTSGIGLNQRNIGELEYLKPLIISVSINSSNLEKRKSIMKDKHPEIALNSLKILKDKKIIFVGTIVENEEFDEEYLDIEKTIKYIAKYDPYYIKVYPFGYTKFYEEREKRKINYNYKIRYKKIFDFIYNIRTKINVPILMDPLMYKDLEIKNSIEGVVKNSPAYHIGFKIRDKILKINDNNILSNFHAKHILMKYEEYFFKDMKKYQELKILIEREVNKIEFDLGKELKKLRDKDMYPYFSEGYFQNPYELPLGLYLPYPYSYSMLKNIYDFIVSNKSTAPLFITSELMYDVFKETIEKTEYFNNIDLEIIKAKNYFWGGNICISDLMTVDDYIKTIREHIKNTKKKPDLIIIPSSAFNVWKKDLKGESIFRLEYQLGIKIEILKVNAF